MLNTKVDRINMNIMLACSFYIMEIIYHLIIFVFIIKQFKCIYI